MKWRRTISMILIAVMIIGIIPVDQLGILVKAAETTSGTIGNVDEFIESSEDQNILIFNSAEQQVKLELCTERTVRIQLSLEGETGYRPDDPQYYMVQKNGWDPVEKTVTDLGDSIQIKTSAMEILVQKDPLRVAMYDLEGNLLSKDSDQEGIYWDNTGVRGVKKEEGTKNAGGIFGFGSGDHGRRANLNRYASDFSEFSMSHGRVVAPFFMSTVGYGIFLNTIEKNTTFFSKGGGFETRGYLDYFFMYGPDFKTILNEYAEITGRMELYGKWAHGFMLSKYGNDNATQAEFSEWINRLREEDYPADCYVFDYGWRGDVADNGKDRGGAGEKWGKQMWNNDTTKFPDIAAMFAEADELGFHVGLHNNAGTPEASGGAALYKKENEEIWVKSYMDSVITTGYGDFFWPDEFDVLGSNTAPTFSSKGAYEAWQEYTDESRPMFMTRGSYAGHHYATAWSGDINPAISELGNQIGFSIDAGLIGYWAVSHDLGGFMSRPSNELYTRWVAEFGAWNGIMRTHGHNGREPWIYNSTAQETLRENLKIRYALYPYTYTLAWQGYSEGVPMMRAMLLEDGSQYNRDAWNLNKQYYYGDWFLVAPALATDDTTVSVWLPPQTTWYNYYTGERYEAGESGKTIQVYAGLEEIPVFVKAGAIIPMGPEIDYADELPLNPLTLDIYPKGETSFTLYEDDGESRKYITENAYSTTKFDCAEEETTVTFTIHERMDGNADVYTPDERSYNLKFNHVGNIGAVSVNGADITGVSDVEAYNAADEAYWLDDDTSTVYVKTEDTGEEKVVVLTDVEQDQPELGDEAEAEPAVKIHDGDVFELEHAAYIGGIVTDTEWKGYTGEGFAKGFKNVGDGVELRVDIQEAGDYNLVLRVNNGKKNSAQYDSTPRQGTMYLDNKVLEEMEFAVTDVWGNTVNGVKQGVWVDYTIENVHLEAGVYTFKFLAEGDTNPGNYNLDSLTFNKIDRSVDAFSQIEAESAAVLTNAEVADDQDASGGQKLVISQSGAWVQYNELRGENRGAIKLNVKSSTGGIITVYENGVGDKVLAIVDVPAGDDWAVIEVASKDTDAVTSNIFLQFEAKEDSSFNMEVDWLQFVTAYPEIFSGDKFELENGWGDTSGNGSLRIDTEWKGYSGTGYLAGWKNVGNYVEFIVNIQETGMYNLVLGTGCGKKNAAIYDSTPRTGALDVNGIQVADFAVEVTNTWGDSNKNGDWRTTTIEDIYLKTGLNTICIRSAGEVNPGNFNLDYMIFDKIPGRQITVDVNDAAMGTVLITSAKDEYVQGSEVTVKAEAGKSYEFKNWTVNGVVVSEDAEYTFVVNEDTELIANFGYPEIKPGDIYELENGWGDTSGKGSLRIDTEWKGYSGSGYLAGWKNVGNYVEFIVDVAESGDYKLTLGTGCGKKNEAIYDSTPRTGALDVNGKLAADFAVEVTNAWGDSNKNGDWRTLTIKNIHLEAGLNTLRIRSAGDVNPGNFNLDYVKFEKMAKLAIVTQPEGATVEKGMDAVVSVEATGEDLTYTWYYKNPGNKKFYLSGDEFVIGDGSTYSIPMYAWRDGQELYCVVTDINGETLQTNIVSISMIKPDIVITKQPADAFAAKGEDVVVSVSAEGEGLTYQWYYKNPGNVKFYLSGEAFVSADGTAYTIPMAAWRDGQQVYCVITNAAGDSLQTDTVTLTMK